MNKICSSHRDIYNKPYSMDELEQWYIDNVSSEIEVRLKNIQPDPKSDQEDLLNRIIRVLPRILVMSPRRMQWYSQAVWKKYHHVLVEKPKKKLRATPFGQELLEAFNYEGYRNNKLVELAAWLNVKTCPYCNMSYTLYSEIVKPNNKRVYNSDRIARFQFDHFLSKRHFPMLSMSLYNLIPCCPICNQGKSEHNLPWRFHPYLSDIQSLFHFEVKRPLQGFYGARFPDYVPVVLKWSPMVSKKESDDYEGTFHLSLLYNRHGDVVQEVFDKVIIQRYYQDSANFPFLKTLEPSYLVRLWFDDYMTSEEIHKRPLSKFKQDVRAQAEKEV